MRLIIEREATFETIRSNTEKNNPSICEGNTMKEEVRHQGWRNYNYIQCVTRVLLKSKLCIRDGLITISL